jgi:hypothetical protein
LAKERIQVPLAFELGWHEERKQQQPAAAVEQAQEPQAATR